MTVNSQSSILEWAKQCNAWGFNVLPLRNKSKAPDMKSGEITPHYKQAQGSSFIEDNAQKFAYGVALINGIGNLHTLEFDHLTNKGHITKVLEILHLPPNYEWVDNHDHVWFLSNADIVASGFSSKENGAPKSKYDVRAEKLAFPEDFEAAGGVELRWCNNQTTVAPSLHPDGRDYAFLHGMPVDPPQFVTGEDIWHAWSYLTNSAFQSTNNAHHSEKEPIIFQGKKHKLAYCKKVLNNQAKIVAETKTARNERLNKSAYICGTYVPDGGLLERDIYAELLGACAENGLIQDDSEEQCRKTIASGIASGKKVARVLITEKPVVTISAEYDRDVHAACEALIEKHEEEPTVFARSGMIVNMTHDEHKAPKILLMDQVSMRLALAQSGKYVVLKKTKEGSEEEFAQVEIYPPKEVAEGALHSVSMLMDGLPRLQSIVQSPTIRRDGSILDAPGYDKQTALYYVPAKGMERCKVPLNPTQADAKKAMQEILALIEEFPFAGKADRANAIAHIFTPHIVHTLPERANILCGAFSATKEGAGKGQLTDITYTIATGETKEIMSMPVTEEEMRKLMFSKALEGSQLLCFDNVEQIVHSAALEGALTSGWITDRILGTNKAPRIPNTAIWSITGNNLQLHKDMARRCYMVKLAPPTSDWDQRTFKLDLDSYVRENRPRLVQAILTCIRAWFVAGKPQGEGCPANYATFKDYVTTMGAILSFSGVQGYLGNLKEMRQDADPENTQWETFLDTLYEHSEGHTFTTKEVAQAIVNKEDGPLSNTMPEVIQKALNDAHGDIRKFSMKIGNAFRSMANNPQGKQNTRLMNYGIDSHNKTVLWIIVRDSAGTDEKVAGTAGTCGYCPSSTQLENLSHGDTHVYNYSGGGVEQYPQVPAVPASTRNPQETSINDHNVAAEDIGGFDDLISGTTAYAEKDEEDLLA